MTIGCILRKLGIVAVKAISYLNTIHKARGKKGRWPESPLKGNLVMRFGP